MFLDLCTCYLCLDSCIGFNLSVFLCMCYLLNVIYFCIINLFINAFLHLFIFIFICSCILYSCIYWMIDWLSHLFAQLYIDWFINVRIYSLVYVFISPLFSHCYLFIRFSCVVWYTYQSLPLLVLYIPWSLHFLHSAKGVWGLS